MCRQVAVGRGGNLMQGTERQSPLRQMGIEGGQPKGQGVPLGREALYPRQQAAQFMHHRNAVSVAKGEDRGHGAWIIEGAE